MINTCINNELHCLEDANSPLLCTKSCSYLLGSRKRLSNQLNKHEKRLGQFEDIDLNEGIKTTAVNHLVKQIVNCI